MKIKPRLDFELIGAGIKLDKNKVYEVEYATNQPHWQTLELVFCEGILLPKEDYIVIKEKKKKIDFNK
jgi:hypothetical protein